MFCKIRVHRNFAKFTVKHLSQSLFFDKVAGLRSAPLLNKRLWQKCFLANIAKFLSALFFTEKAFFASANCKITDYFNPITAGVY